MTEGYSEKIKQINNSIKELFAEVNETDTYRRLVQIPSEAKSNNEKELLKLLETLNKLIKMPVDIKEKLSPEEQNINLQKANNWFADIKKLFEKIKWD